MSVAATNGEAAQPRLIDRLHWYDLTRAELDVLAAMLTYCQLDSGLVSAPIDAIARYSKLKERMVQYALHGRKAGTKSPAHRGLIGKRILLEIAPANPSKGHPPVYQVNEPALRIDPAMRDLLERASQSALPGVPRPWMPGEIAHPGPHPDASAINTFEGDGVHALHQGGARVAPVGCTRCTSGVHALHQGGARIAPPSAESNQQLDLEGVHALHPPGGARTPLAAAAAFTRAYYETRAAAAASIDVVKVEAALNQVLAGRARIGQAGTAKIIADSLARSPDVTTEDLVSIILQAAPDVIARAKSPTSLLIHALPDLVTPSALEQARAPAPATAEQRSCPNCRHTQDDWSRPCEWCGRERAP